MTDLGKISAWIGEIENDQALLVETDFMQREQALETLDRALVLLHYSQTSREKDALEQRANKLKERLSHIHQRCAGKIRADIKTGSLKSAALRDLFGAFTAYEPSREGMQHSKAEVLDLLVNLIFKIENIPPESRVREEEMVHLDMLPSSAVLDMIDHARIDETDCFYDLGSGLGQPTILVNLLCGAKTIGVEYQPSYSKFAQRRVEILGLDGVSFINADARKVNYADGTAFLLFSPFKGNILERVLEKLRDEPISDSMRICSFGPCSEVLAGKSWLKQVYPDSIDEFKLMVFEREK